MKIRQCCQHQLALLGYAELVTAVYGNYEGKSYWCDQLHDMCNRWEAASRLNHALLHYHQMQV